VAEVEKNQTGGGDRRKGDRQQTHHDVGRGQVCDEHVGDCLHCRVASHNVNHQSIAGDTQHEDDRVDKNNNGI